MSNYTKGTDFRSKDFLPSGDPDKVVSGSEIDTEFNNIATAIATKADAPVGGGTTIVSNPTTSQALTKGWGQAVIALTDGATVTIDATGGNIFTWTIAGNRTLAFPTGLTSRTITYAAGWFKPSTLTVQPNAATAKVAVLRARANGDGTKLFVTHFYNDYVAA
jgi:hypothetical protein